MWRLMVGGHGCNRYHANPSPQSRQSRTTTGKPLQPAPQVSRDLSSALRGVILSPAAAATATATAREVLTGAARIPPPPARPGPPFPRTANPRSPDLPLGLGPPRAPAAPPRRRRPPARPSVHLQQAVPPAVLPGGASRARGLSSCSPAEGSAGAEAAALSLEGRGSYRGGGGGGGGGGSGGSA
ncbi:homeobox even-skipped homolog protein 2-like [Muntiacus reevesi]|uniref:homeobox even-skipped homolog protein 2-like n=1 Tax=Muntiacus reevesi TaxID=9886 RepID=UPI00330733E4